MDNIWNYIIGISTPISAIGTLIMTWCVYRLNSKSEKRERYLRHMIDLYYKIEEDYNVVYSIGPKNDLINEQSLKRIKINSTLMLYYLQRIPVFYKKRWEFISILYDTSCNPESFDNCDKLTNKFIEFCRELQDNKNIKHTGNFDYDGRPIEQ